MLLKVATAQHADSFLIIDRVDNIKYDAKAREFTSLDDLNEYMQVRVQIESCRLVLDPRTTGMVYPYFRTPDGKAEDYLGKLSEQRTCRVNEITYERKGEFFSVVFDTVAYICNDEGKTLERVLAGGPLNY